MTGSRDDRRIDEIRDALATGTYRVDSLDVADAMLKQWRSIDRVDPDAVDRFLESFRRDDYSASAETDSDVSSR